MQRITLISSIATAAFCVAAAAVAQTPPPGSGAAGTTAQSGFAPQGPSSNASPKATGVAPGLQNNRTETPRATPGNERAQERTGTGDPTSTGQSQACGRDASTHSGQASSQDATRDRMTTGQTPKVEISEQQRTQLRSRFKEANIRTVSRDEINVSIGIGVALPSTVTFVPLPGPILAVAPQFRGYHAVRVGEQILIVEPGTRRIVHIINI